MLAEAATWAVSTSNTELLKALLQAGLQINEPLEEEMEWCLLHFAASSGTERMVRFLLDNGADPAVRDKGGLRPIDIAYEVGRTNMCQAMANLGPDQTMIGGFPEEVLAIVFGSSPREDRIFVSLNGEDLPEELLHWIRHLWPKAQSGRGRESEPEGVSDTSKAATNGSPQEATCVVAIKKMSDTEYRWWISVIFNPLAGWQSEGTARLLYGYWIKTAETAGEY